MRSRCLAAFALLLFPACAGDAEPAAAAAAFTSFQAALQRGDRAACRDLLTEASAAALEGLPWARVQTQQPLTVLGAERGPGDFRVRIADPNQGDRQSHFVVVREYGRLVVDLIATAGLHTEVVEAAGSTDVMVPRELTPADYERIRQRELATPPR